MATDITSAAKHPTARRRDPACGTCRKKCRKCDRKRPICDRCRSKGLHCEGYPPRFQFCEMVTAPDPQSSVGLRRNSITISPRPLPLATILGGSPAQGPPLSPPAGSDTPAIISITDSASPQVTLPPSETQPDSNVADISSSPSSAHCQLSALYVDSDSVLAGPTDLHREILTNRQLIDYFDSILSEHLTIHVEGTANPFREHVLPLAHQHQGVLHALLGLSACHMHLSGKHESQNLITISLRYRVLALHSLGSLLSKEEEISGLTISEGEYVLGMVLLLVLHDVSLSNRLFHTLQG
ncbi:hypothetical protein SAMD00023353_1400080 [Rosellinia necatrix]|uniref:Zn(2)-C6 fungal-type domain-containing protein n=1 Tax=Rosellinia necatrix TaxID=77044 RepID=A0A1S8A6V9_ROSNE|nr:hypothetical protein SAMD00023353_1400080 [Rosellinia necatrix]